MAGRGTGWPSPPPPLCGPPCPSKADRERMQSALVVAQREAAEREAAITALQGAEVEVMRLQNALHTSQKVATA